MNEQEGANTELSGTKFCNEFIQHNLPAFMNQFWFSN